MHHSALIGIAREPDTVKGKCRSTLRSYADTIPDDGDTDTGVLVQPAITTTTAAAIQASALDNRASTS